MTPWLLAFTLGALIQEEPDKIHVRVAKKVAPATVHVEGGRQRGSGILIDRSGILLTSPTACGTSSTSVTVLVHGSKSYTGRVMGRANNLELVLVKIDAKEDLPFVEMGDSEAARVGQVAYVFGDSFDSIKGDDQPAMSMGVISGIYEITQKHDNSLYAGKVLETSAAVNPNQDGGPLVDREGRLLGIVTLNYDDSKFTGVAVPIHLLKPAIEKIRREYLSVPVVVEPAKAQNAWLGLEVRAVEGGLEVTRVARNSPAEKAGLRKGDVLLLLDAVRATTEESLRKTLDQKSSDDTLKVTFNRAGAGRQELAVRLAPKRVY
jgi:S1-C subfamily serine protease